MVTGGLVAAILWCRMTKPTRRRQRATSRHSRRYVSMRSLPPSAAHSRLESDHQMPPVELFVAAPFAYSFWAIFHVNSLE